jgi:predicted secreted hydrolase
MRKRLAAVLLAFAALAAAAPPPFDPVTAGAALRFPQDFGAHPTYRLEWWYVTGHLESSEGPLGFQVTFFRWRNRDAESNPSRFSPGQIVFAHAALADPRQGRLAHDQRIARALAPLVEARAGDTHVRIDDWSLVRESGTYRTRIPAEGFTLELAFTPTQPVMLQGDRGFSRKGAKPSAASYYYSEPQLRVAGRVTRGGRAIDVGGVAWLDHEWSSELLVEGAVGWDWLGANLDGGGALMAFRIRGASGETLWSGATLRAPGGEARAVPPEAIRFAPRRTWKSPRTGTLYPVAMDVSIEGRDWRVEPLMDDQELDARATTGTLYWEGAARVTGPNGETGRGYLELTGYARPLPF